MMNIKRKNRKIKYNEENYINLNYMVNGKAVIPVELETVDDLFMKHDYKQFELSDDVCKYIEEIAPIRKSINKGAKLKKLIYLWQGMRESNSQQWFWRPLLYHLTNPLYKIILFKHNGFNISKTKIF